VREGAGELGEDAHSEGGRQGRGAATPAQGGPQVPARTPPRQDDSTGRTIQGKGGVVAEDVGVGQAGQGGRLSCRARPTTPAAPTAPDAAAAAAQDFRDQAGAVGAATDEDGRAECASPQGAQGFVLEEE
jgi:hypothetical protein